MDFSNSPGLTQNTTQHADRPQHAFSLDAALEALHKAWSAQLCKDKYLPFTTTLQAAIDKITEYYKKTADSDVFILVISQFYLAFTADAIFKVLNPSQKIHHFKKYWPEDLVCNNPPYHH